MTTENSLMKHARKLVDNKSIFTRVSHSSYFHSARSATKSKGSAVSKGASVVLAIGKKAMQLIPIPVLGDLASEISDIVDRKVRARRHSDRIDNATSGEELVKFKLKELSVEEFDRYRWKLADAVKELQLAQTKFKNSSDDSGDVCSTHLELAMAIAQASRRHKKLMDLCMTMVVTMEQAIHWATDVNVNIKKAESDLVELYQKQVEYDLAAPTRIENDSAGRHANCTSTYCYYKGVTSSNGEGKLRHLLIEATRELSDLAKPDLYYSLKESPYKAD